MEKQRVTSSSAINFLTELYNESSLSKIIFSPQRHSCLPAGREDAEKKVFVWRTEGSELFSEEIPPNEKLPVLFG
jgi:hypothetical protein